MSLASRTIQTSNTHQVKKVIAIIVPEFPVRSETFVTNEIKALIDKHHKVVVFCFRAYPLSESLSALTVIDLSELNEHKSTPWQMLKTAVSENLLGAAKAAFGQRQISTASLLKVGLQIAVVAKSLGVDHIHCHFMQHSLAYGLVAAKWLNIPISAIGHGHDVYQQAFDLPFKLQHCDVAIAVCRQMQAMFEQAGAKRVQLLHCGINTNLFKPQIKSPMAQKVPRLRMLFIGRLVEKKGLFYGIHALAQIPEGFRPTLDIVGSGPLEAELRSLCTSLELNGYVKFLGFKPATWLQQCGGEYDALLAPFIIASNGDRDTGPLVVKEAMSMGLVIIASDIMGCSEIIDSSCGILVEPGNIQSIRQAIHSLIVLPFNRRRSMASAARERVVAHFDIQRQAAKLSHLVEELH